MLNPSSDNNPRPGGGAKLEYLGDAHELLSPHIGDLWIDLRNNLPFEAPSNRIPCSTVTRDAERKTLQVTVNIPGAILGEAAWCAVGRVREPGPIFKAAGEILKDISRLGQHFTEIQFMPSVRDPNSRMSQFDYRFEVRATDETRPHMGYLSVYFEFLEAEKEQAAIRAGTSIDNIIGFCALHGLQRTVQSIVDASSIEQGPLQLTPLELPLPEELSMPEVFSRLLPDEATDRAFKSGGDLGRGRPFIEFREGIVHIRIPCTSSTAEQWSYYLNESKLAGTFGINSSYVELPGRNSQLEELIGELARSWAAFPEDEQAQNVPTRKEPGYWHVRAPIHRQDPYGSLQGVLQFVTAFRDILLRGKEFWAKQDP
jgi:hypothetical protein